MTVRTADWVPTEWVVKEDKLQKEELLGEGAAGKVYKGTYEGKTVAIKELTKVC